MEPRLSDANIAGTAEHLEALVKSDAHPSIFRRIKDHLTLLAGIRFCAVFNAGALIALIGYGGLMVGLDRLGISIVVYIPMVATFAFGLLLSGVATTTWFASRHHMAHAGVIPAVGGTPAMPEAASDSASAFQRAVRLQSLTTNFVAASYVTFIAGLAGLPMLIGG